MRNVQNISIRGSELDWLKYPKQINGGKLDSVRCETGRHRRHNYKKSTERQQQNNTENFERGKN